ncbi:MAG: RsmG family class I SAM-dependent methyltransferase [Acidimicrobiales bacterium]
MLERAQRLGFVGPGPPEEHVAHALGFAEALGAPGSGDGAGLDFADLGAGGGLPSLPILVLGLPRARATLIDSSQRRTAFLVWAGVELELEARLTVVTGRAEEVAHRPGHRRRYDAVVARGFGPPATTIEIAVGLVRRDGRCVISEPPGGRRWPPDVLAGLGLVAVAGSPGFAVLHAVGDPPEMMPRPVKRQRREPLF